MPATDPRSQSAEISRGKILLVAAVLSLATLWAYVHTFRGPFIFDDKPAILENPTIRHLWPLTEVFSPPSIGSSVTGRPLVNLSFAINYAISGENPWSYHALNLLIHVLGGLALFGIVRLSLGFPIVPEALRGLALPTGAVIAALWLLHPLQTESVSSVVQRTESLVGLFFLLTLYAFIRGIQSARPTKWLTLSFLACLAGMAAKEVMVTAPLIVLWYDRTFVAGSLRNAWRQRPRYYLGLFATWGLLALLVLTAGGTRGEAAGFGLGITPWTYALTQCGAIIHYLRLAFWPSSLVLDYGTDVTRHLGDVLPQALLLLALAVATIWACLRRPLAGFLGAWFFVILAPSSSIVPLVSQTVAEHRMYLPLAAVIALVVGAATKRFGRKALLVALVFAIILMTETQVRNRIYETELSAWTDTVAKAPLNARAQINLAESLIVLGRPADALAPAAAAVALRPGYAEAQTNLGIALTQLGHPDEALPHCEEAVRLQPDHARNHSNLGATLLHLDRAAEAAKEFEAALTLSNNARERTALRRNLGSAYFHSGRIPAAIAEYEAVLKEAPESAETHYSLGLALGLNQRYDEAIAQLKETLRLQPNHAPAREALDALQHAP